MKAKLVDAMPSGNWIYEVKFDGYRALALRGGSGSGRLHSSRQAKWELPSAALEVSLGVGNWTTLSASDKEKPHSRQNDERGRSHELLPLENSRIKSESFAYTHLGHAPPCLRERQRHSPNYSSRP